MDFDSVFSIYANDNKLPHLNTRINTVKRNFLKNYSEIIDRQIPTIVKSIMNKDTKTKTKSYIVKPIDDSLSSLWRVVMRTGFNDAENEVKKIKPKRSSFSSLESGSLLNFIEFAEPEDRIRKTRLEQEAINQRNDVSNPEFDKYINDRSLNLSNNISDETYDRIRKVVARYIKSDKDTKDETIIRNIRNAISGRSSKGGGFDTEDVANNMFINDPSLRNLSQDERIREIVKRINIAKRDPSPIGSLKEIIKGYEQDLKDGFLNEDDIKDLQDLRKVLITKQEIKKFVDSSLSYTRIERIATTEIAHAYNIGRLDSYVKRGVKFVKWNVSLEHRMRGVVCKKCNFRMFAGINNTNIYELAKVLQNPDLIPALHPNCACYLEPIDPDDEQRYPWLANLITGFLTDAATDTVINNISTPQTDLLTFFDLNKDEDTTEWITPTNVALAALGTSAMLAAYTKGLRYAPKGFPKPKLPKKLINKVKLNIPKIPDVNLKELNPIKNIINVQRVYDDALINLPSVTKPIVNIPKPLKQPLELVLDNRNKEYNKILTNYSTTIGENIGITEPLPSIYAKNDDLFDKRTIPERLSSYVDDPKASKKDLYKYIDDTQSKLRVDSDNVDGMINDLKSLISKDTDSLNALKKQFPNDTDVINNASGNSMLRKQLNELMAFKQRIIDTSNVIDINKYNLNNSDPFFTTTNKKLVNDTRWLTRSLGRIEVAKTVMGADVSDSVLKDINKITKKLSKASNKVSLKEYNKLQQTIDKHKADLTQYDKEAFGTKKTLTKIQNANLVKKDPTIKRTKRETFTTKSDAYSKEYLKLEEAKIKLRQLEDKLVKAKNNTPTLEEKIIADNSYDDYLFPRTNKPPNKLNIINNYGNIKKSIDAALAGKSVRGKTKFNIIQLLEEFYPKTVKKLDLSGKSIGEQWNIINNFKDRDKLLNNVKSKLESKIVNIKETEFKNHNVTTIFLS